MFKIQMRPEATKKSPATTATDRATNAIGRTILIKQDRKVFYSGRAPIVKGA